MSSARTAILAGTGIYDLPGFDPEPVKVDTPFGPACYHRCALPQLVFLPRHGLSHDIPPHSINYRANFWCLHQLGVEAVVAAYAVGSLHTRIKPRELALVTDFIDHTRNRIQTFYSGGGWGVGHADMSRPYCQRLNQLIVDHAQSLKLQIHPRATYVATEGPRMESPAEVRMLAEWGGDVVGMTGVPEVALARELGMHFAGVALSINLAVGLEDQLTVVTDLEQQRRTLVEVFQRVLRDYSDGPGCGCTHSVDFLTLPQRRVPRAERQ